MAKLELLESSRGTQVVLDVIRKLTGDTSYAKFAGVVTATVNGVVKVDRETIEVQLTNSRPNFAYIDVHWEDFGYKNFHDMGVYGRMDTRYNQVKVTGAKSFVVIGDNYRIEISY